MTNVADKVRKLLRLATSSDANEAAQAAAKAQGLIDQYNLSEALLSLETGVKQPEEPIRKWEEPIHRASQYARWRWMIFAALAKHNGCTGYLQGGDIRVVGRASDVEAVRYLFAFCERETDRLAKVNARGNGRTYTNNYRIGVAEAIRGKLDAQKRATLDEARAQASRSGGMAIVRLNTAIAQVDRREVEARDWVRLNMRLRFRGRSTGRQDGDARAHGRRDGQEINLSSKGSVGAGRKTLGA